MNCKDLATIILVLVAVCVRLLIQFHIELNTNNKTVSTLQLLHESSANNRVFLAHFDHIIPVIPLTSQQYVAAGMYLCLPNADGGPHGASSAPNNYCNLIHLPNNLCDNIEFNDKHGKGFVWLEGDARTMKPCVC